MRDLLKRVGVCSVLALGLFAPVNAAEPAKPAPEVTAEPEPLKEVSDLAVPEPTTPPDEKPTSPMPEDKPGGTESLLGGEEDPLKLLDDALTAMDEAAEELATDAATDQAVEHQEHAVEQLKKLLEAAQQSQSKQNQQKNSSNKDQSQDRSKGQDQQQSSSDPMGAGGKRRKDDDKSGESSERVEGATQSADGPLGPGGKTNAVWGHLPPREQEALFRSLSDKFLPEYEGMIRKYYEALADEK
jgi:hypothetical protein